MCFNESAGRSADRCVGEWVKVCGRVWVNVCGRVGEIVWTIGWKCVVERVKVCGRVGESVWMSG